MPIKVNARHQKALTNSRYVVVAFFHVQIIAVDNEAPNWKKKKRDRRQRNNPKHPEGKEEDEVGDVFVFFAVETKANSVLC